MPVSLGEWRVRIGTFIRRRKKEYDYNYFSSKLFNLIKRAKNVQSPEENNSECNTPQSRSQFDGPECDVVKESGSSCDVKSPGPNEVSHSESSCAENSSYPTANETNPLHDTTDVQNPDPRPCTEDTVDDKNIAINLMSPEYPTKSSQISKTDQPEVGTSESYSHVPAVVPGEPARIKLHKEETSNSAPSRIEDQSLGLSPTPRQDQTRNTKQKRPSIKKVTEYHGSPTCPLLGSGINSGEADAIKGNGCPDMSNILLLRSGDVERNPGPNDNPGILTELELYLLADGMDPSDFRKVGLALGSTEAQLSRFEKDKPGNSMGATYQMLYEWRKTVQESEARDILVNKLESIELVQLADSVRRGQVGDHIPSMTEEEIDRVAEDVKRYLALLLCQIQADPLNSELLLAFERIYTNLTLMEEDKGTKRKTALLYDDLLGTKVNGIYPKRLLVEGEGGVGKTTFCAKIAWDWIHGKGYKDFKLVLVVLLREAKDKTVGEVVKSYLSDNNPVTAKQLDKYILSNPDHVFLVLDGLDEFAVDLNSTQQIALITHNRLFKSGTVLITSRQWRSDEIRKNAYLRKVFAFIAIEGFSPENLSSYITKFFHPDKASSEDLSRFISNNAVIRENMAPYPIYTAMLCIMWKEFDGERREAMSKLQTFSQLFDEMVRFLVDHYLSKLTVPSADADEKLDENRSEILNHEIYIGCVAFQGLLKRRLVFSEEEFQSCPGSVDTGCKVGVLTKEKHIPSRRDRRHHSHSAGLAVQFPHKLFQEYLSGMYLASFYNSNRNEYDKLIANIIPKAEEYRYLLYFTAAQQKEIGLDIVSLLIRSKSEHRPTENFIVDVAFESQDQSVAKSVADHLYRYPGKTLEITGKMQVHTVSGHIFVMNHREPDDLIIRGSRGRTVSEDLAEFICSSRSLRFVAIVHVIHDVFYSVLANKAVDSKMETLHTQLDDLKERPAASRDLAQFICKMPHLKKLTLRYIGRMHDAFYSTLSSEASSAKIETLDIQLDDLSERPAASRDLAQFFCKMPYLKKLTFRCGGRMHDDFYSTSSSMAASAKIETLAIQLDDLSERPFASRGLAEFICKMPHLKNLTLCGQQSWDNYKLHDAFYSTFSSMASSAKIETLNIHLDNLSERPSASCDLAQVICKMPHLKNLTLYGQKRWQNFSLHNDFFSTSSSIASSAKIETLDIQLDDLSERPAASRDLAQVICKMPHLKNLTVSCGRRMHDAFYSTLSSEASSAKIETLEIRLSDLSERPSASCDLAQFICKMPHLKSLTLRCDGCMNDDFYSTLSSEASSAKIETLVIRLPDFSERPSASRGLAEFICKMPHLKNLTLSSRGNLNDDFYSKSSSLASSAKIETLDFQLDDFSERPAASRDLAQFFCKMPYLKNLTLSCGDCMNDTFYSTSPPMALSAKVLIL
ncbi:uncharacterized protein LOC105440798 [Strongylocentrotus purpuratus]|uniref:Uncharacterized protein n=1 Tax=Strongylocentrotus purpuratus TaxID=7668 RepID=A0A7M7NUE4_STRPU|nr:uncharacterized protein LOC105440798 [Strongylocentrotus purpuratus]